ncbi:hypothetical protein [Rhodococcus erythropolis]|uniref:hypothetical protein n=1 Tax=Rhodococcus erythropolis TaxID=1833 RepID=UPI000878E06A|nr:hypothetical protein [Rhodococcus erythropolis]MDF2467964.1 AMP-dependent synthetase [Rhodococcus erythropolis]OFV75527.1 hypothetical protein RERY_38310 [Rhodococcus erythropolis]
MTVRLGTDELAHILADADVRVLFVDAAHAGMALKVVADAGLNCRVYDYSTSTPGADSYHELLATGSEDNVEMDVDIDAPARPGGVVEFMASGIHGQRLLISRNLELVVAHFGAHILSPATGTPDFVPAFIQVGTHLTSSPRELAPSNQTSQAEEQ